jgi:rod shape-determining protein MreD
MILLQVLIVKNIYLGNYTIPFPYVLFILLLPFQTPRLLVLTLAFFTGLTLDAFYDTQGLHAFACVLMGFLRAHVLQLLSPREGYDPILKPVSRQMGNAWFITYSTVLIFTHHFALFYLEIFRFNEFFFTFLRVTASSIITFIFVYLTQLLFYRQDSRLT